MALQLPTRKVLTLEAARIAMDACEAEAAKGGWKVVIAIVDEGGHALMVHRVDGPSGPASTPRWARRGPPWPGKGPPGCSKRSVNNGRFAFLSISQGMALLQGGVPLEIDGQVIGAIGVSGVKASDDEAIALAGIHALQAALS